MLLMPWEVADMDDSRLNNGIVILTILLISSLSLNGYLYYSFNHTESPTVDESRFQSNYEANLTAYEVPLYSSAHYLWRDNGISPASVWKGVNSTFNPDLNISFRFQYDSELIYVFIETPFMPAASNYTMTLYFSGNNTSVATVFDATPPRCPVLAYSCASSLINTSVSRWNNGWEDKEPYNLEIVPGSAPDFTVPPTGSAPPAIGVSQFDIAIPINLIGSPQNGSSMGFAFSLYDIDHHELYEWGNPDDFSTYRTLMFS